MMVNFILFALLVGGFSMVNGFSENMIAKGKWSVLNVQKCAVENNMLYKLDIKRRKLNRTHDGFNGYMKLQDTIDDSFAIRIDVCKYVDGGCKPYQVIADDCLVRFLKKYAEENLRRVLEKAGVDPPDFPVRPGEYNMTGFVFNYAELPDQGMLGDFGAVTYMLKDGLEVACVDVTVRFTAGEDD